MLGLLAVPQREPIADGRGSMTHELPPGDDPSALHDPEKWVEDADAEPEAPTVLPDDDADDD